MKNKRRILMIIFTLVLVILGGCAELTNESSAKSNNQSSNNNSAQSTDDDSSNKDLKDIEKDTTENTDNNNANKTEDTSNNVSVKEEAPFTNNTEGSLKEEYLRKLNNIKKEAEELEATDSSTYALKKVEDDRWDIWDELLNEIYGVLKDQLPPEEMDQIKEEQRNWMKYRDDSALEASLKYKGGTQEHIEYVAVLANLTEERCYELVANYMK